MMHEDLMVLVRSGYDAVNRRDFDYLASIVAADFEIESVVTNKAYRGSDAVRRLFEDLLDAFGEYQMVIEEMIDAGDQVVVLFRIEVTGRGSGVPMAQPAAQVWTIRDGLVVRCKGYLDRQDALASVGLS